ncbi:sphingomyelin phosphodiesterase 4-like isoform X2 [Ornithodoros turicata]|uniref:sphingomyelin phosphodiesterase 4-like isoform X2 n=1 Tax=Ornithodoros turicata TaxID=34597 RepID=UPI0031387BF8
MSASGSSNVRGPSQPDRINAALSRYPLERRCGELAILLQELSLKEIEQYLPNIVEHIFGFNCQVGWGLCSLLRASQNCDFSAVRQFLGPEGPLLRIVYRLLGNNAIKFEFPVSCLPIATQKSLREGSVPPLYANKVYPYGCQATIVQLNAFEYYMFNFAYHIVNPAQSKQHSYERTNTSDALYFILLEDYLRYFLPTDRGSYPTLPSHFCDSSPPSSPFYSSNDSSYGARSVLGSSSVLNASPHERTPQRRSLLKKNINLSFSSPCVSPNVCDYGSPQRPSSGESWCSELFIAVLVEFWLGRHAAKDPPTSFASGMASLDSYDPSHDHMKTVRVLIKYLHFFANHAPSVSSHPGSFYASTAQYPLDDLRSKVIPQFVRKKLYVFLKQALTSWPLDASFRLPLETWLSFIQPWRYAASFEENHHEKDDRTADSKWQPFIQENLLFYTGLFNVLLPRFFHMDLSSRRNSLVLYRVTKVLSQAQLVDMVVEVERSMGGLNTLELTTSPSSTLLRKAVSASTVNAVRQQTAELEEPGYVYKAMFSEEVRLKVNDLLKLIAQAQMTLGREQALHEPKAQGWWASVTSLFDGRQEDEAADLKRGLQYLQLASRDLCRLFKLQPPSVAPAAAPGRTSLSMESPRPTSSGLLSNLSLLERTLEKMGPQKHFEIRYQGNPDTQPIRSYEIAFLVRILHLLSSYINDKYAIELQAVYHGDDLVSHMARQVLEPPTSYTKVIKTGTIATAVRERHQLPARLCLRPLANQQVVGYLGALLFLSYIFDFAPLLSLTVLLLIWFAVILFRALVRKYVKYGCGTQLSAIPS